MSKERIRRTIGKMNRTLGLSERIEETHNIFSIIEIDQKFITAQSIAIYVSMPDEVQTHNIIERWCAMGKRVSIPRVKGERMEFVEYESGALKKGAYGILEPTNDATLTPDQIDLMIVPGVAFCADGRRLGRGGGYYDRYLAQSEFKAYTIGIGFAHQLLDEMPTDSHDMLLSRVVCAPSKSGAPSLPKLIVEVIDAAGYAAIELGCGVDELLAKGYTWVLSRLSINIERQPTTNDDVVIDTWIEDCNRIATTRNFILTNRANERIGVATSQWCMIDMKARRPIDITSPELDYTKHVKSRNLDIERPRKIPKLDGAECAQREHVADELDIDMNNHVNTMRYIEMMLEMIDPKYRDNYAPIRVDIHFSNESRLGDKLTINHQEVATTQSTQQIFEIIRPDNTPSVRAIFDYLS